MEKRELYDEMITYFDTVNEHYTKVVKKKPGKITITRDDMDFLKSFPRKTWNIFAPNDHWPNDAIGEYKDCFIYLEKVVK